MLNGVSADSCECDVDHSIHETFTVGSVQFVALNDAACLAHALVREWQALHTRDVIIVKLGVEPYRVRNFGQAIDWAGEVPIYESCWAGIRSDDVPGRGVAVSDDDVVVLPNLA